MNHNSECDKWRKVKRKNNQTDETFVLYLNIFLIVFKSFWPLATIQNKMYKINSRRKIKLKNKFKKMKIDRESDRTKAHIIRLVRNRNLHPNLFCS